MNRINRRAFLSKSTVCMAGVGMAGPTTICGRDNHYQDQQPAIREYRILGRTGFRVSDIGCGFPGMANESVIKAAIAGGINFIDTIEGHGGGNSEVTISRAIKTCPRESLFINSKIAVTETTPILTVIEPVYIPLEKSSPSRALIIFLYILMGLIVGFGIVIIVPFIEYNFNPNINKFWLIPKIY